MPIFADAAPLLPAWVQIVLGTGLLAVLVPALVKQGNKMRGNRKARRAEPVLHDAAAITDLQGRMVTVENGIRDFTEWLKGSINPITKQNRGDGFIDVFPQFQDEVLTRLDEIKASTNGNGAAQ